MPLSITDAISIGIMSSKITSNTVKTAAKTDAFLYCFICFNKVFNTAIPPLTSSDTYY